MVCVSFLFSCREAAMHRMAPAAPRHALIAESPLTGRAALPITALPVGGDYAMCACKHLLAAAMTAAQRMRVPASAMSSQLRLTRMHDASEQLADSSQHVR